MARPETQPELIRIAREAFQKAKEAPNLEENQEDVEGTVTLRQRLVGLLQRFGKETRVNWPLKDKLIGVPLLAKITPPVFGPNRIHLRTEAIFNGEEEIKVIIESSSTRLDKNTLIWLHLESADGDSSGLFGLYDLPGLETFRPERIVRKDEFRALRKKEVMQYQELLDAVEEKLEYDRYRDPLHSSL